MRPAGQGTPGACCGPFTPNEKPRVGARGLSTWRRRELGARRRGVNAISHRECVRPIIRWCAVFRLAGGVLLPRHTASRLMNVGNQAESKPFTFIFGVGISEYIGSMDSDAGRFKGATVEGRAVLCAVH